MQAVLWFNILGFTLMFAAFVLALLYWMRGAPDWLKYYLLYHFFYMAWQAVMSVASLNIHLLGVPPESFGLSLALTRAALSAGIILSYPPFILRLTGKPPKPQVQLPIYVLPVLLIAATLFSVFYSYLPAIITINVIYNAFLLFLSYYGLRALQRQPVHGLRAVMKVFLRLSLLLYLFVVLTTPLFFLIPRDLSSSIGLFLNGLFSFLWGAIMTVHLIRRFSAPEAGENRLPEAFKDFYRITRREEEILEQLLRGKNSQEIGDALFISRRTVETHLYNLYRKTKTSNRVELINRIGSF
jgi:DNA-binding CsgD family transcriptional regulator